MTTPTAAVSVTVPKASEATPASRSRSKSPKRRSRSRSRSRSRDKENKKEEESQPIKKKKKPSLQTRVRNITPHQFDHKKIETILDSLKHNGVEITTKSEFVGKTIVASLNFSDDETYYDCGGILLSNGTAVWFERDGEGNGAGIARTDDKGIGPGLF